MVKLNQEKPFIALIIKKLFLIQHIHKQQIKDSVQINLWKNQQPRVSLKDKKLSSTINIE